MQYGSRQFTSSLNLYKSPLNFKKSRSQKSSTLPEKPVKSSPMSKALKAFIIAIAAMGVLRFILTVNGLPNNVVKYFSMSAVMLIGLIYFAFVTTSHKERLKVSFLLVMPYMTVEVLALAYTWASGRQTIFHASEYTMGTTIRVHTIGHLVGGLTWEPLLVFAFMEGYWA